MVEHMIKLWYFLLRNLNKNTSKQHNKIDFRILSQTNHYDYTQVRIILYKLYRKFLVEIFFGSLIKHII